MQLDPPEARPLDGLKLLVYEALSYIARVSQVLVFQALSY
jgi:hypothetical protein